MCKTQRYRKSYKYTITICHELCYCGQTYDVDLDPLNIIMRRIVVTSNINNLFDFANNNQDWLFDLDEHYPGCRLTVSPDH